MLNDLQFLNNPAIFVVEEVSKEDVFNLVKEEQFANIYSIFSTFEVLKLDKSNDFNFSHPKNIYFISVI